VRYRRLNTPASLPLSFFGKVANKRQLFSLISSRQSVSLPVHSFQTRHFRARYKRLRYLPHFMLVPLDECAPASFRFPQPGFFYVLSLWFAFSVRVVLRRRRLRRGISPPLLSRSTCSDAKCSSDLARRLESALRPRFICTFFIPAPPPNP